MRTFLTQENTKILIFMKRLTEEEDRRRKKDIDSPQMFEANLNPSLVFFLLSVRRFTKIKNLAFS